jgi:hypothetical protein
MKQKTCLRCHRTLPIKEFWRRSKEKDGFNTYCKACLKPVNDKYRNDPRTRPNYLASMRSTRRRRNSVPGYKEKMRRRNREYARIRRSDPVKREKLRAYQRVWSKSPNARRARRRKFRRYVSDDKNRLKVNKYVRAYRKRFNGKARAHDRTKIAIEKGILIKEPCEICGESRVDAHHEDYSRPLEVRWLCKIHHGERHREIRQQKGKGGATVYMVDQ